MSISFCLLCNVIIFLKSAVICVKMMGLVIVFRIYFNDQKKREDKLEGKVKGVCKIKFWDVEEMKRGIGRNLLLKFILFFCFCFPFFLSC